MRLRFMAASVVAAGVIGSLSAASAVPTTIISTASAKEAIGPTPEAATPAPPGLSAAETNRPPTVRSAAVAAAARTEAAVAAGSASTPTLQNFPIPSNLLEAAQIVTGSTGIPQLVLDAYRNAQARLAAEKAGCNMPWYLLAGIGRIESGHAGGGRTDVAGTTMTSILGPRLNGTLADNAVISDTDGGALDGDPHFDRAVGPMQFLPQTWQAYRADGNNDGKSDPNNVFDAALAAGTYLCAGGFDMRNEGQRLAAILRYNNSRAYANQVLTWAGAYSRGALPTPGQLSTVMASPVPAPAGTDAGAPVAEVSEETLAALAAPVPELAEYAVDPTAPVEPTTETSPSPLDQLAQGVPPDLSNGFDDIRNALEDLVAGGTPAPAVFPAPQTEQAAPPVNPTTAPAEPAPPAAPPVAPDTQPAPAPVDGVPPCLPTQTAVDLLPEGDRARLAPLPLGPCVENVLLQIAGIPIPPAAPPA